MSRCTAARRGHRTRQGALDCPSCRSSVWGPARPPSLPPASDWRSNLEAARTSTDPEELSTLLDAPQRRVAIAAASNPHVDPEDLADFAISNGREWARVAAIANTSMPLAVVASFSGRPGSVGAAARARLEPEWVRLGVSEANSSARRNLSEHQQWWTLEPDSSAVMVALILYPNP